MTSERYVHGHVERLVSALRPGDRVDLAGDIFADPIGHIDALEQSDHPEFQFEFETVESVDVESADCICVYFESGFACGFPPDHWIDVDGEQIREAAQ